MCKAAPLFVLEQLSHCHRSLSLLKTKQLHATIVKSSLSPDPFFATNLVRLYAAAGHLSPTHQLFDQCPQRSVYLWNSIIRAHFQHSHFNHALSLFARMRSSQTKPDAFTFACVSRALWETTAHCSGIRVLHGCVIVSGFGSNSVSGSALVTAYSKLGLPGDARQVFDEMPDPNLVLCNALLSGYGHGGLWSRGLELFYTMLRSDERPDGYSLVGLISCFGNSGSIFVGRGVHALCLKMGLDANAHVGSALVSMYSRSNCLTSAYRVFNDLSRPDLVSWSSLISGFSHSGECDEALLLFAEMIAFGGKPDPVLIASVLSSCAHLSAIKPGKEIHGYVFRHRLGLEDTTVSSSLVHMYGKCGFSCLGYRTFEMMKKRNVVAYNSVILCLGLNGLGRKSVEIFHEMVGNGFVPDRLTFSALLGACCHAGLVEEGRYFLEQMENKFGVTPGTEHYVYVVKLLAMLGDMVGAYHLIQKIPASPESGILGALLSSCNFHGNLKLGEMVARQLFEIHPDKAAYRVILSNMYAEDGRWNDKMSLRDETAEGALKKVPGRSWIV